MIFSRGSNHSRGVLVLINEQLQYEINNTVIDDEGRYIHTYIHTLCFHSNYQSSSIELISSRKKKLHKSVKL